MVCAGGAPGPIGWFGGDCECPFVVERNGVHYLFRNVLYGASGLNVQYASKNPFAFGVGHDRQFASWLPVAAPELLVVKDRWYVAALEPALDWIRVAPLEWTPP